MDDYCKINVGTQQTGVIGLKTVLAEIAQRKQNIPDKELGPMIRELLSGKNYFAPAAEPLYEQAFVREFKKFVGMPVEPESAVGLSIKVLGPGCPRCRQLRDAVLQLLTERGLAADFEYVTDPLEIAGHGILMTPALIMNDVVKVSGKVPSAAELQKWIADTGA